MKSFILSTFLTFSYLVQACPGSNLMTFQMNGQDAFVLNMQTGKINRVESNKNIVLLKVEVAGSTVCVEDINSRSRCSKMFPSLNILGQPGEVNLMGKKVDLEITLTDGTTTIKRKVERFPNLARSARGCGPVIK
ncbi:MAG: hypothetical protein ACK5V3_05240 [Bdellovibrionales bacterium]